MISMLARLYFFFLPLLFLVITDAHSFCSPVFPKDGDTIICTNNDFTGINTEKVNLTINVVPNALVSDGAFDYAAIELLPEFDSMYTISNSGVILGDLTHGSAGISIGTKDNTDVSFSLFNAANALIIANGSGISLYQLDSVSIVNRGSILGGNKNTGEVGDGISLAYINNTVITNHASGEILSDAVTGDAIYMYGSDGTIIIDNAGLIEAVNSGIYYYSFNSIEELFITNSGTIRGDGDLDGDGEAITIEKAGFVVVDNVTDGVITSTDKEFGAVYFRKNKAIEIKNAGLIQGSTFASIYLDNNNLFALENSGQLLANQYGLWANNNDEVVIVNTADGLIQTVSNDVDSASIHVLDQNGNYAGDVLNIANNGKIYGNNHAIVAADIDQVLIENGIMGEVIADKEQGGAGQAMIITDAIDAQLTNHGIIASSVQDGATIRVIDLGANQLDDTFVLFQGETGSIAGDVAAVRVGSIAEVAVTNQGSIFSDAGIGLQIRNALQVEVVNGVNGVIQSNADDQSAIEIVDQGIETAGDTMAFTNHGVVFGNDDALLLGGYSADLSMDQVRVTNTGRIIGDSDQNAKGRAVFVQNGVDTQIYNLNAGVITSTATAQSAIHVIYTQDFAANESVFIENDSDSSITGRHQAIFLENEGMGSIEFARISNDGTVIGDQDKSGEGSAIVVENVFNLEIVSNNANSLIQSTATDAAAVHIADTGDQQLDDSVYILNTGLTVGHQAAFFITDYGHVEIVNSNVGNIRGDGDKDGDGSAIVVHNALSTFINHTSAGGISSTAVASAAIEVMDIGNVIADDVVQIETGSNSSISANHTGIEVFAASELLVFNSGDILGDQDGLGGGYGLDISVTDDIQIVNEASGEISTLAATDAAVGIDEGETAGVLNHGLVEGVGDAIRVSAMGQFGLSNTGEILSSSAKNIFGRAVSVSDVIVTQMTNHGVISSDATNDASIYVVDLNSDEANDLFSLTNDSGGEITSFNDGVVVTAMSQVYVGNAGLVAGDLDQDNFGHGIHISDANGFKLLNVQGGEVISTALGDAAIFVDDINADTTDFMDLFNAGVIGANADALRLRDIDFVELLNEGSLSADLDGNDTGEGLDVTDVIMLSVSNASTGLIDGFNGLSVVDTNQDETSDEVTISNEGEIKALSVGGKAIVIADMTTVGVISIAGEIVGEFRGIEVSNALETTVVNGGLIESLAGQAVTVLDSTGIEDSVEVTNTVDGTIRALAVGTIALLSDATDDVVVNNDGLIEGAQKSVLINDAFSSEVLNSGTGVINSLSADGVAVHVVDTNADQAEDEFSLGNGGIIEALNAGGQAVLVNDVSEFVVQNEGVVQADQLALGVEQSETTVILNFAAGVIESLAGGVAIDTLGSNSTDTFMHHGSLIGDALFHGGNDNVILYTGMTVVNGVLDTGTDSDTLWFQDNGLQFGEFDLDGATGVEQGAVQSGHWTLSGTGATLYSESFAVEGGTFKTGGPNDYNMVVIDTPLYQHGALGTYETGVNGAVDGQSDLLIISGLAQLDGTMLVDLVNGDAIKAGSAYEYTVLTADAGVNDIFTDVPFNSKVLDLEVVYDPNDVRLIISRKGYEDIEDEDPKNEDDPKDEDDPNDDPNNDEEPKNGGLKYFNDISMARYMTKILNSDLYSDDLKGYIANLDTTGSFDEIVGKFRTVNPEEYDVFNQFALDTGKATTIALGDQLRQQERACHSSYKGVDCDETPYQFWLSIIHRQGERDDIDEHANYDSQFSGALLGFNAALTDQLDVGLLVGYYDVKSDMIARGDVSSAEADGDIYTLRGYFKQTGLMSERTYLIGSIGYSHGDFELERDVVIRSTEQADGIWRRFEGSADTQVVEASLELGWMKEVGVVEIDPYVRINGAYIQVDDIEEEDLGNANSNLRMDVELDDTHYVSSELGLNLQSRVDVGIGTLSARLNLNAEHIFIGNEREMDARFANVNVNAPFESTNVGRTMYGIGGEIGLRLGSGIEFGLGGDYRAGDAADAWGATLNVRVLF